MNTTQRHNSDKRVIRTKKAIRIALFKLMESKELGDISISELTANANVNRRTFYTHYRSITDILDEIESEIVQALTDMLSTVDHTDIEKSVAQQFIGLYQLVSSEYDDYFNLLKIDTRGVLGMRLRNAIKISAEKIFTPLPDNMQQTSVYTASYMAGGFIAFFTEWYYSSNRIPIEQAAEMVGRMTYNCIKEI